MSTESPVRATTDPQSVEVNVGGDWIALRRSGPGVVEAQSSDHSSWYPIQYADALFPRCSCTAATHGLDCKHVIAVLTWQAAQNEEDPMSDQPASPQAALVPAAPRAATITDAARQRRDQLAIARAGFDDALYLAEQAIQSGMTPKTRARNANGKWEDREMTPQEAAIVILAANDLSFTWTQAWNVIAPIEGKPFFMARGVHAVIERSGKGYINRGEVTPTKAAGVGVRYLPNGGTRRVEIEITLEMAQKAGWTHRTTRGQNGETQKVMKENWQSMPAQMLWARTVTALGWSLFPDVLMGMDVMEGSEPEKITQADVDSVPSFAVKTVESAPLDTAEQAAATEAADLERPADDVTDGEFHDVPDDEATDEGDMQQQQSLASDGGAGPDVPPSMSADEFLDDVIACIRPLGASWGQVKVAFGFTGSSPAAIKSALVEWLGGPEGSAQKDPVAFVRDRVLALKDAAQASSAE
ncbi:MAG: hypothetical protein RLZZ200_1660 [Pseudomonadota bacterium]|jgi:hypothetical protein